MSRRCRASLIQSGGAAGDLSSGCNCGRLGPAPEPCTEPLVYGNNVILDPSFEQYAGAFGLGGGNSGRINTFPGGFTVFVPGDTSYDWNLDSEFPIKDHTKVPFWTVNGMSDVDTIYSGTVATDNPDQGVYHFRVRVDTSVDSLGIAQLSPLLLMGCEGNNHVFSASAEPGDLLVWSMRAMANVLTDTPGISLYLIPQPRIGTSVGDIVEHLILTAAYAPYTLSMFVPDDTNVQGHAPEFVVAVAELYTWDLPTVVTDLDADSAQLTIFQGGKEILLCAQSGLITIDNSTTETAFL